MQFFRTSVRIAASPERVWDMVTRAERMPEWQANIVEITQITGRLDRVGASYTVVAHIPPGLRTEERWEVTEVDPLRLLAAAGGAPFGGAMRARNTLVGLEGGESWTEFTTEMEYDLPGGIVGKITDRILQHAVNASNQKLKAIVEAESSSRDEGEPAGGRAEDERPS